MGGCQSPCVPIPFVPPNPKFFSAQQLGPAPFAWVRVVFNMAMDVGVLPALASFRIVVDGVPIIPTGIVWTPPQSLDLTWNNPDPAVTGTVQLIVVDNNLRSSIGTIATAPQEMAFFP